MTVLDSNTRMQVQTVRRERYRRQHPKWAIRTVEKVREAVGWVLHLVEGSIWTAVVVVVGGADVGLDTNRGFCCWHFSWRLRPNDEKQRRQRESGFVDDIAIQKPTAASAVNGQDDHSP